MSQDNLRINGAREHNLKNINVEIPRDKLVVLTGISGSGKSSLAFDTIFAEGQRRYVESLSSYARQFLGQMNKPDVDSIEGLSPAVAIDQKSTSNNPRSTVGTVTEIFDYLRLLYARVGIPHCPICGRVVQKQSAQEIVDNILAMPEGSRLLVLAPMVRERKGTYQALFKEITKSGFTRVRVDGEVHSLEDEIELDRYKKHTIEAVVDRLVIHTFENEEDRLNAITRLTDSVETALRIGEGYVTIQNLNSEPPEDRQFSENLACPVHGSILIEIEPRTFSFNTPHGACPVCQGLGFQENIDPKLVVPNRSLSLKQGAIKNSEWDPKDVGGYHWQMLEALADQYHFSLDTPFEKLTSQQQDLILFGSDGKEITVRYVGRNGRKGTFKTAYEGVVGNMQRRYQETQSDWIRIKLGAYITQTPCPECGGKRLRKEALGVTIADKNIIDVTEYPVDQLLSWINLLESSKDTPLNTRDQAIADRILREINARLSFLTDVGLDYLTLERSASTLSGGEAQRIRLATQIGSKLMGVLYVLDEPSIGLHPRDNDKLLDTLKGLRDLGNTVLVVEHDEETMRNADWIVDLGPGAGEYGGWLVAEGTPEDIEAEPASVTGDYLSGRKMVPLPEARRQGSGNFLKIKGASENNLKNIDVDIPLGKLVCITGVSGSGKSTLLVEILYNALARKLMRAHTNPGKHDSIEGTQHLDKIINIDQSPIGRTPRSNPATYTGLFDSIRDLFTELPESKIRGYQKGRFSFNVKGGRCEACMGEGQLKIEMQFLPDVYVPCEVCRGTRYNHETLQVRFKDKNIADVLDMTVETAIEFFDAFPKIKRRLQTLNDVGLGYIRLGQPAPTLSGGEAQRVKLSKELSRIATGRTLYVLDEPSVGLHAADVHKLIEVLQELVDSGNTVLIIEHNMDIIKVADWIIDLGPDGGLNGGEVIAQGTPEQVCENPRSYTGQYLKKYLQEHHQVPL
ncbi:MAG: excinuclease ABC subunit UvrA [Anaerolineaceae bacterium]|nr:excinuclease ABC subunit UvrA [Anaerolineaceae bacterium]MDD4043119.1 excinuclease ABC subunit UvrA [Anaerolineaceae bacterium]MDD4578245.1 excinuclease ABC subunit UvrA [Anaerolineaceae bacterium]